MKNTTFAPQSSARRRRRGTARLFVLGAAFTATSMAASLPAHAARVPAQQGPAQAEQLPFEIAAGTIGSVTQAFEAATGLRVTLANDMIRDLPSPGVRGRFSVEQAIERMLAGTGVGAAFTADRAVTFDIRTAEFVAVEGRTPRASSPKLPQPLRDTPQTITVVPASVMQAQGATTLRDVLRNVTGISIQAGEGGVPAGDNLSIRGFSARTDFFVDGVRDAGGYARDPFNVEQVEVIKGPSSSYSGRGSTGGSVNLATKAPHLAASRAVGLGLGSSGYQRGTLDVNQPLAGGTALRVNAMWTDADTPGRDVVTSQRWGIAPSLAFGLGTPTRVKLSYSHLDQQNVPDYGIPWVPAANVPLRAYADQAAPVEFSNFYGLASRDYEDTTTHMVTGEVQHDVTAALSLRSLVRYGRTGRDSLITAPRFAGNDTTDVRRTDWKSRDQSDAIAAAQTDLTARFAAGRTAHTVVTGIEIGRETSTNRARIETGGAQPTTDLFNPDPFQPYASRLERNGAVTEGAAVSAAAYAFDTVELGPRLQMTGGVRVDRFALDYRAIDAAGAAATLERVDTMASWRGGVIFKPRPEASLYAGAGTSLNPSTEGLSLSASTVAIDPEKTISYEVGTKWDALGGTLGMNAAAFRTAKSNARTPGINPGDPPTVLDGEHVVSGIEIGANGSPTARWQLFGSYTFMASEITRSNNAAEVGNEFGNTPNHSFTLWTTYRLPGELELGGGAQYVGDRFNSNTAARTAPAYWLFDAMAAYRVSDQLTLRLNGLNLADRRYIDRVGGGHFIPGPGRSLMLTADVGF